MISSYTSNTACKKDQYCAGPWESFCHNYTVDTYDYGVCRATDASVAPPIVKGGNGATGRGYNNLTGSLTGSDGATNSGGGGGGGAIDGRPAIPASYSGGDGIVVIRYLV